MQCINETAAAKLGLNLRTFSILVATAVLGARDSISMYDGFVLLGKDIVVARLVSSLKHL